MPDNTFVDSKPNKNIHELSELTLGKVTPYISEYTPSLLQGVPRALNRDELNIDASSLPFIGEDVWYGYEISWLNLQGKPVVAIGEFRFACHSKNIVESKSFKLYLNSFNQSRFTSKTDVIEHMITDLTNISGEPVDVSLYDVTHCPPVNIEYLEATCIDDIEISIDDYNFDAELLTSTSNTPNKLTKTNNDTQPVSEVLVSHLLKSNCLITNQPDWATIYISYQGEAISHEGLLRYLISFRKHNEFHEQCVERIFTDLLNYFSLQELTVYARYTRRGGLDINPFRSTHKHTAPSARTHRQ